MKYLTLIRHAKSDWGDPSLPDFARPLSSRGKKAAPKMGKRMAERGDIPDLLISSPANRAKKTARLIAKELKIPKDNIECIPKIFEAKYKTLIKLISDLSEYEHVALVGHNPGISDLAEWLCPNTPGWLPTCAILTLKLDITSWKKIKKGSGHIVHYDYPKKTV